MIYHLYFHSTCIDSVVACTEMFCPCKYIAYLCMVIFQASLYIACIYNNQTYANGETFPATDGCNNW